MSRSGGRAPSFLTSTLHTAEWSASRPSRFTATETVFSTQCIGGSVGPKAVLDEVEKRKTSRPVRNRTPAVEPVARR
jgi:hypothetical protein